MFTHGSKRKKQSLLKKLDCLLLKRQVYLYTDQGKSVFKNLSDSAWCSEMT